MNNKHNYKLSDNDKKEILVNYYLNRKTQNVNDLCKKYNISSRWLYELVKSDKGKEILEKHIIESKKNFSKKLDIVLDKTIEGLNKQLENEDIKALDYAKIMGIMYDKSRLEHNLSTSNSNININIKIEK